MKFDKVKSYITANDLDEEILEHEPKSSKVFWLYRGERIMRIN
jgi:hypothetical protein